MASKSKQIYNTALNKGYQMLQGMQRQNRYNLSAQGQSYVSGSMKNASLDTDDFSHVDPSQISPELDRIPTSESDQKALDEEKSQQDPSALDYIWEGIKTPFRWAGEIKDGIDDTLWGKDSFHDVDLTAPTQVYRDFQYKRLSTQLTSTLNELNQLTTDQDYVDYLQNDFIPILKNKAEADYTLQQLAKQGVKGKQLTDAYNRCKELQGAIDKVNSKLKQNVKTSGLLDNFYSINQRDKMSFGDKLKSYNQSLNDQYSRNTGDATNNWWGRLMKSKNALDVVKNVASPVVGAVLDASNDLVVGAKDLYNAVTLDDNARNQTVLDQIKKHPNEHGYDNLFIDYSKDQNGKAGYLALEDQLREQLPEFYRLKNQKKVEAIQAKDDLTKGNAWFDPSKLDKKFLNKQSSRDMGLLGGFMPQNLQYSLPELGSSFSDLKDFAALSVMDFAANNVVVPLILTAATHMPAGAAKAIGLAESASKVNKALEVSKAIREAQKIEGATTMLGKGSEMFKAARAVGKGLEATNGLKYGIGAAETAGGIYFTNKMRQQETNSEVMDAYSQKVLTQAMAKNVDMNRVIKQVDEYAKIIGTDTDGLDPQQKVQMALGYNIKTDVPEFEKIKKDARRGLNKVYNDNMTLAVQDYWEVMPFLNFNGAFMKSVAKSIFKNRTGYDAAKILQKQGLEKAADAMIDAKVSKVANKFFKNTANKVSAERVINYVNTRAKTLIPLGLKEGTEEGQQQLLQNRYQRGEYDNYTDPSSTFCIDSFINDLGLGADAIGCYLGINSGDPDNGDADLRRAMNIGFTTSMFFRAPHAASNMLRSNADNTRNLIASIKNDRVLRTMVADNYGKAQDKDHVGIFFDAMTKSGVTRERLNDSLEAMKRYKGEGVTDDYIDADKELVDRTWSVYKSDHVNNELLPNLGIDKNSSQHRQLVQTAVRDISDFANAVQRAKDQGEQFEEAKNKIAKDAVDHMLGQTIYDELNDNGEFEHKSAVLTDQEIEDLQRDHTIKNLRRVNQNESISKLTDALNDKYDELAQAHDQAHVELKQNFFKEYDDKHKDDADKPTDEQRFKAWEDHKKSQIETLGKSEDENDKKKLSAYQDKLTKEEFTKYNLNHAIDNHLLGVLNDVYATLKHKEQLDDLVRVETGTDIDTTGLKSMTDYLKGVMDRDSKVYSKVKNGVLGSIDGVEELDRLAKQFYINSAMSAVLQNKAAIYNDSINFDADSVKYNVRETLWSELTKEEKDKYRDKINKEPNTLSNTQIARRYNQEQKAKHKEVYDNVNKYKAKVKDIHKKGQKATKNDLKQLKSYQRKIQIALAQKDLHEAYVRDYIANRTKKEVTSGQDIDDIEDNNKHAIDKNNIFDISNIDEDVVDTEVQTYRSGNLSGKMLIIKLKSNPEASLYLLKQDGIDGKYGVSYADKCSDLTDEEKAELVQQVINALPKGSYLTLNDGYVTINNNDLLDYAGKFLKHDPQYEVVSSADDYGNSVNYTLYLKDKDDIIVPKPKPKAPEAPENKPQTPPTAPESKPEDNPDEDDEDKDDTLEPDEKNGQDLDVNDNESDLEIYDGSSSTTDSAEDTFNGGDAAKERSKKRSLQQKYREQQDHGVLTVYQDDDSNMNVDQEEGGNLDGPSDNGNLEVNPEDNNLENTPESESKSLDSIENGNDYNGVTVSANKNGLNDHDNAYKNNLSRTFFYNPEDDSDFHERRSHGNTLDFGKEIGSGKELAEKLLNPKWIKSCYKYYVVSGNTDATLDKNRKNLTVNLVIEEKDKGGKVYIVSMKTPGDTSFVGRNGVPIQIKNNKFFIKNNMLYTQIGIDIQYNRNGDFSVDPDFDKLFNDQVSNYSEIYPNSPKQKITKLAFDNARLIWAEDHGRAKAFQYSDQIDQQINDLEVARNKIIDAYCDVNGDGSIKNVPETVQKNKVVPENFNVSNGSFTKSGVQHTLIGKEQGFGLSNDIEEITKQTRSGEVVFGYGVGAFGTEGNKFQIFNIHSAADDEALGGVGLAGKVYYYINKDLPGTNNSENGVALMLHEQRFDMDVAPASPDEVQLSINPLTGKPNDNQKASFAEILLYLLCGKVNKDILSDKDCNALSNLIVHNGPKTLVNSGSKSEEQQATSKLPYYQDKQLCFEQNDNGKWVFEIGDKDCKLNNYRRKYNIKDLFPSSEADEAEKLRCEQNRKQVTYLLSKNFHWNTDKSDLFISSNINLLSDIDEMLKNYFKKHKKDTEFKLFGNDQLVFKKDDFFDKDGNEKDIDLFAWLLKNDKLTTDTDKQKFKAPFIFADGAVVETTPQAIEQQKQSSKPSEPNVKQSKQVTNAPSILTSTFKTNENLHDRLVARNKFNITKSSLLSKEGTEERRGIFHPKYKNVAAYSRYDNIILVYADDNGKLIQTSKKTDVNKYLDVMAEKMYEYAKFAHNEHPEYPMRINTQSINIEDKDAKEQIRQIIKDPNRCSLTVMRNEQTGQGKQLNGKLFTIGSQQIYYGVPEIVNKVEYSDDKQSNPSFSMDLMSSTITDSDEKFTGVYQSNKSKGKLDAQQARGWLAKTLGIDEGRVIVLHAIERSASSEEVFGVTKLVTDSITNEMHPIIALSEQAGRGVPYHEAWHYVNLLINTPSQRQDLYEEYMDAHNISDNTTFAEVEEMMAEDFRRYCEMKEGYSFTDKLKRLFNNILTFLHIYKKDDQIQQVYDVIRRGDFKGKQLDPASAKEFNDVYGGYVNSASYSIPGVYQDTLDKLSSIKTYQQFYNIGQSLASSLIANYGLTTPEDVSKASTTYIDEYIKQLQESASRSDDQNIVNIVNDIANNKSAFANIIDDMFNKLGINSNFSKKFKEEKIEHEQNKDTGEEISEHDIDHFSISKKTNVSFRARLFLTQVPETHFENIKDENGKITKKIVYDQNKILGGAKYVPFDVAWKNILQELWFCDSYDKKDQDGKYLSTSIVGRIHTLAETSKFFAALKDKIDSIAAEYDEYGEIIKEADIELQNQIFGTVVSQMPNVTFLKLNNPKVFKSFDNSDSIDGLEMSDTETTVADRSREWKLYNDNTLRAKRNIPRKWSSNLYASGIMISRNDRNEEVISETFASNAEALHKYIMNIKRVYNNDDSNYSDTIKRGKMAFNAFCRLMLIPIGSDDSVYNRFIAQYTNIKGNMSPSEEAKAILNMFELSAKGKSKIKSGSILEILSNIKKSSGLSQIKIGNNFKALDQILNGYATTTDIASLASAYNEIYPSSAEFTVTGPDGKTVYPVSQNNYYSDRIRELNDGDSDYVNKLANSEYCKHSLILKRRSLLLRASGNGKINQDDKFKLCLIKGLGDDNNRDVDGVDYMGLSPVEDYLSKLKYTFENMIVLPTMGDKTTYYTIKNSGMELIHDLITYDVDDENGSFRMKRFSNTTLDMFYDYYTDEINTLKQYYNRDNIAYLIAHQDKLLVNYHGKVHKGEGSRNAYLDFSGNGGKFRYFYDVIQKSCKSANGTDDVTINMNQQLELAYKRQKNAMDIIFSGEGDQEAARAYLNEINQDNIPISEMDGFESIRKLISSYDNAEYDDVCDSINDMLMARTMSDLEHISSYEGVYQPMRMAFFNGNDKKYYPQSIPSYILNYYAKIFDKNGYGFQSYAYGNGHDADYLLSAIGSHVASTMLSIIETEKIFTGDPAFYKWKYLENTASILNDDSTVTDVSILKEKHSDKIKRLGAVLSPGENLRTDYGPDILKTYPELNRSTYTFANIGDINAKSLFLDQVRNNFRRQELINYITQHSNLFKIEDKNKLFEDWYNNIEDFDKYYKDLTDFITYSTIDSRGIVTPKSINKNITDEELNEIKKDPANVNVHSMKRDIEKNANQAVDPISDITVSDAQVCIRPAMYRMLRIQLGEWTFDEDDEGYSDEIAYNAIEKDDSWMHDKDKQNLVSKFQLKPLKMTYFSNENRNMYGNNTNINTTSNVPVYNKMAIFPMFKYACTNKTGVSLYNRMNKNGNKIDMLGFESAVKVGCNQQMYKPFAKGTDSLEDFQKVGSGSFDDSTSTNFIDRNGNTQTNFIDRNGYTQTNKASNNQIVTQIQYIDRLRLQLNTDAHEATERPAGTQFFKLCFSNIDDNKLYMSISKGSSRTGKSLKSSIMDDIDKLTECGNQFIKSQYLFKNGKPNIFKIRNYIKYVAKNNGIEANIEDILNRGACVASLPSRLLFEQIISKLVNGKIIDITMQGGSAVQQSIFGFTGVNKNTFTYGQSVYHRFNNGKEIKYISKGNTMQVLLSMNLFRPVLPNELWNNGTYDEQRQWLVDHDVICGTKTDNTESDPNPFGIGYRIPTQGMSSIFAFQVADVLPRQSGDVIVVPREFTAQTGSDFDVDKLFMATISYDNDGKPYVIDKDQKYKSNQLLKIYQNDLLYSYMDVITSMSNFKQSRGSLDTITDVIKNWFLPQIEEKVTSYQPSGYELIPSFQGKTKMEFSTGKSGIGPFALSTTNLALTQFVGLTEKYGDNIYGLGPLYSPLSSDGTYVSDWLSAMINAHVDVAKDPYIFTLNVNKATYNYITFLLRAGKSISTFSFIAQPAIKQFANISNASNSIYGNNIDGKSGKKHQTSDKIMEDIIKMYQDRAKKIFDNADVSTLSERQKQQFNNLRLKFLFLTGNISEEDQKNNPGLKAIISRNIANEIFDTNAGIWAIQNPNSLKSIIFQMEAIRVLSYIKPKADALSALVNNSRIDTKKFGNSIATQLNFVNNYKAFRYGSSSKMFAIKGKESSAKANEGEKQKPYNALDDYFDHTFLSKKLFYATEYTRTLLQGQTLTSTKQFENTFYDIMCGIYGSDQVNVTIDNKAVGSDIIYSGKATEDFSKAIGNAVDNVMRYRALSNYSSKLDGVIDIAGKDKNIRVTLYRLLYGLNNTNVEHDDYEGKSLFDNIRELKNRVEHYESGVYHDLKDNEFLRYISPVSPTSKDKIQLNRLALSAPQMDLSISDKTILTSAFDQLLISNDPLVSRVAEDLVLYGYYNSYDQGGVNSYFDIVPAKYRQQYDIALSRATQESVNNPIQFGNKFEMSASQYSIKDVIAKNYWYDDKIIKPYSPNIKSNTILKLKGDTCLFGSNVILSSRNSDYFKINKKDNCTLYHKVGTISMIYQDKNNKVNTVIKKIYMPMEKAGLHGGKIHQFEFYVAPGEKHGTIFKKDNSITEAQSFENLSAKLQSQLSLENKKGTNKDNIDKGVIHWDDEIDDANITDNVNNDHPGNDSITNENGNVTFEESADSKTDVAIKINDNYNVKDTVSDISKQMNNANDSSMSLTISSPDAYPSVTEEQITKYTKKVSDDYRHDIYAAYPQLEKSEINKHVEEAIETNSSILDLALDYKIYRQFDEIFRKLKSTKIQISELHVSQDKFGLQIARAAKNPNYNSFIDKVVVDVNPADMDKVQTFIDAVDYNDKLFSNGELDMTNVYDDAIKSLAYKDDSSTNDTVSNDLTNDQSGDDDNLDTGEVIDSSDLFGELLDNPGKAANNDAEDSKNHEACSK